MDNPYQPASQPEICPPGPANSQVTPQPEASSQPRANATGVTQPTNAAASTKAGRVCLFPVMESLAMTIHFVLVATCERYIGILGRERSCTGAHTLFQPGLLDSWKIRIKQGQEMLPLHSRCPHGCSVVDQVLGMGRINSSGSMQYG